MDEVLLSEENLSDRFFTWNILGVVVVPSKHNDGIIKHKIRFDLYSGIHREGV